MERFAVKHQQAKDEVQALRNKTERTQAETDAFDEERGSEDKLQRLEIQKKIFKLIWKMQKQSFWRCESNKNSKRNYKKWISKEDPLLLKKEKETHLKKISKARNNSMTSRDK